MRYIDADDALERLDMICNDCPSRAYCEDRKSKCRVYSGTEEFLINASTIEAEPCTFCAYNPPSSCDGKPCTMCPAVAKGE